MAWAPVPGRWLAAIFPGFSGAAAKVSSRVFQAPQPVQRPDHLGNTDPQDEQTYSVFAFAMTGPPLKEIRQGICPACYYNLPGSGSQRSGDYGSPFGVYLP